MKETVCGNRGARGSIVGSGTMLQAERSRDSFPDEAIGFSN
jgi:hypothetical protein